MRAAPATVAAVLGWGGMAGEVAAAGTPAVSPASARPNILFIFSDDHAVQAMSCYGSKVNRTPNIDRIAKEGATFQLNFCANSICAPSRASVLTGKHSHLNGVPTWERFDGTQTTFPQLLQKAGYRTGIFGKWHLESDPTGFDEWMVYPGQGNYYNPDYLTATGQVHRTGYAPELTTDLSLDFIRRQKDSGQPFLLMCHFKAPHRNWMPGPKYLNLYDDMVIPEPPTLFDDYSGRASPAAQNEMEIGRDLRMGTDLKCPVARGDTVGGLERMTPEQRKAWDAAYGPENAEFLKHPLSGKELVRWKYQRYMKDYLRCVAAVDDNVGRLLDYLKETGLDQNTIVIYSSDQGFYLGEHGWFDKRWMYEESFRMPLVMRWPGVIRPGTVVEELTQNIDYAPTFLEACGLPAPREMQGRSFLPLLKREKIEWRDALYYHYYDPQEHHVAPHYGIRTKEFKLIRFYTTDEWELFDLKKDPMELRSVYADPAYAGVREKMKARLEDLKKLYKNDVYTAADSRRLLESFGQKTEEPRAKPAAHGRGGE